MRKLQDKVAIITGASQGIGEAIASLFAENGAKVIITDINDDSGRQVVSNILEAKNRAEFLHLDVSSEQEWKNLVDKVLRKYGKVDILINDAAIAPRIPLQETSEEQLDRVIAINIKGTFFGCKHIVPAMQRAGGGSIVNVSSTAGIVGLANYAAYSMSKGAVRLLSKSAACDFALYNIRVNSLHPGTTNTSMVKPYLDTDQFKERIKNRLIPRLGMPNEIAQGALFLASDDSKYMTGTELIIDGGLTAI